MSGLGCEIDPGQAVMNCPALSHATDVGDPASLLASLKEEPVIAEDHALRIKGDKPDATQLLK